MSQTWTNTSLGSSDAPNMKHHIYLNVSTNSVNFPLSVVLFYALVSTPIKTKLLWPNSIQKILLTNLLMFSKPFMMIPSNKKPQSFALMLIIWRNQSMLLRENSKKLIKTLITSNPMWINLLTLNTWKKYKKIMLSIKSSKDHWIPSKIKWDWNFPSKMIILSWKIIWFPSCWSAFQTLNGLIAMNSIVPKIN